MVELKFKDFITPTAEVRERSNFSTTPLDMLPLTMTYTPMQRFGEIYNEDEALMRGTLFPDIDKPFCGKFTGVRR